MNNETTPVKTVVTHGFVVDEQGRKFSKSVGNGVSLQVKYK
jgi:isoleucyl-tRNA synthetase